MKDTVTIFDAINDIAFRKRHQQLPANHQVNPFLLQRWLSMYSPEVACLVAATGNRQWASMTDAQVWYDYWCTIIPRLPFKRIAYIKKSKQEKSEHEPQIEALCAILQLSKREVAQYVEQDPSILALVEDKDGLYRKTHVAKKKTRP